MLVQRQSVAHVCERPLNAAHSPQLRARKGGRSARSTNRGLLRGGGTPTLPKANLTRRKKGGVQKRRGKRTAEGGKHRNLDKGFDFNYIDFVTSWAWLISAHRADLILLSLSSRCTTKVLSRTVHLYGNFYVLLLWELEIFFLYFPMGIFTCYFYEICREVLCGFRWSFWRVITMRIPNLLLVQFFHRLYYVYGNFDFVTFSMSLWIQRKTVDRLLFHLWCSGLWFDFWSWSRLSAVCLDL